MHPCDVLWIMGAQHCCPQAMSYRGLASPGLLTNGDGCGLGLLHPPANAIAHVQIERSRITGELGETGNPCQAATCFRR